MITLDRASFQTQPRYATYTGLEADTKPTGSLINNGDEFQEIDTGKIYKFDSVSGQWYEQPESGGSGGTTDYDDLNNKPSINGVVLEGNKTSEDLNIGNPTQEQVQTAVDVYLTENPVSGMTPEQVEQLNQATEDVSTIQDILQFSEKNPELSWQGFYYILNGVKKAIAPGAPSASVLSNPIHLNVNDKVVLTTLMANNRDVITLTNESQSFYQTAVISNSPVLQNYEYVAPYDCWVVVGCYDNNSGQPLPIDGFSFSIVPGSSEIINTLTKKVESFEYLNPLNYYGVLDGGELNTLSNYSISAYNTQGATVELLFSTSGQSLNRWFYGGASTQLFAIYELSNGIRISLNLGDYQTVDYNANPGDIIHAVITYSNNNGTYSKTAYVNGEKIGTIQSTSAPPSSQPLTDKITQPGITVYQKRIWNKMLTDEEVSFLYNFRYPTKNVLLEEMRNDLISELIQQNISENSWLEPVNNQTILFDSGKILITSDAFSIYDSLENLSNSVNILNKETNTVITNRTFPDFEIVNTSRGAHDCTFIGENYISFNKPTDGLTCVLNGSTLELLRRVQVTFVESNTGKDLEMKSCDYKFNKLLVGNGRAIKSDESSYEEQGANLYVFYNAPAWFEQGQTDTITFDNCGDYDKIDISSLGYKVYGFWGGFDNCVFVSCNLFNDIYLIQLAQGTTQFSQGTYTQADSGRYNGTFEILGHWNQNGGLGEFSGHGGQFYKGVLYIATNDSSQCRVYKCVLNENEFLKFEALDFDVLSVSTPDYLEYRYIDGVCIKDGVLYAQPLNVGSSRVTNFTNIIKADI